MLPHELTLILAATRDMGIGLRGTLPWTGLKKEMAYFARVTKRLPPQVSNTVINYSISFMILIDIPGGASCNERCDHGSQDLG